MRTRIQFETWRRSTRSTIVVLALSLLPLFCEVARADEAIYGSEDDGPDNVDGQFGPYDYYRPVPGWRGAHADVESHHMGFVIAQQLMDKDYCGYFNNLDYTLRAFPNHPKALVLMAAFLEKHQPCQDSRASRRGTVTMSEAITALSERRWQERDAEYYFRTALRFMTEDTRTIPVHAETHALYGDWLRKNRRLAEALKQYESARAIKPELADTYYGLGMLYLDQKDLPKAVANAKKAYSLGNAPSDLRDRLTAAGVWPEAPAAESKH